MKSVIVLSILSLAQLVYTASYISIIKDQHAKQIISSLRKKKIHLDAFGVQFIFETKSHPGNQIGVFNYLYNGWKWCGFGIQIISPIVLGLTAWRAIYPKTTQEKTPFTLEFPGISLATIFIYAFSTAIHEIGHVIAAVTTGASIEGFGFGFRLFIPQFFVKIGNTTSQKHRSKIAAAGSLMNVILMALSITCAWIVYAAYHAKIQPGVTVMSDSNNFAKGGGIQELNGIAVRSKSEFQNYINEIQNQMSERYIVFDDNSIVDSPVLPVETKDKSPFSFAGLKIPAVDFDIGYNTTTNINMLTRRIYTDTNGEILSVNVVQPIVLGQHASLQLEQATEMCQSSSDKWLCVLPAQKEGSVRFYLHVKVDNETQVIVTDLEELLQLNVVNGLIKRSDLKHYNMLVELFVAIAEINAGMALLSLAPFPSQSDGSEMIEPPYDEVEGQVKIVPLVYKYVFKAVYGVLGVFVIGCVVYRLVANQLSTDQ